MTPRRNPSRLTSAGRREHCIATVLDTQSFGEEAHHSLSHALELFPVSSSSPANEPPVEPSPVASQPPLIGYALLDSGATHPMRQASSEEEWIEADEVQVSLAGDQTTVMRLTRAGTLLLPPGRDGLVQPIVPMGAIIEQLGYKLVWSAGSCKLYPPDGKSLRLRVKNGCPELVESQALTLISRLEEHKMQQVEELRRRTEEGKGPHQTSENRNGAHMVGSFG